MAAKKTARKTKAGAPAPAAPVPAPVTIVPPVPEPTIQPEPVPQVKGPDPVIPTKPHKGLTPDEEIKELRDRIASDEARLYELEHPIIEFPKMVKGRTFNSRAEQDAAGPDFADKK